MHKKIADELNLPLEWILGLAAKESGWGEGRLAVAGNNYFSQDFPAPLADPQNFIYSLKPSAWGKKAKLAIFPDFATSGQSFAIQSGGSVRNAQTAEDFGKALQSTGRYGIDKDTNGEGKGYVDQLVSTINAVNSLLD